MLNQQIPAPTLRAKAGDRVRVIFYHQDGHFHGLHFHGLHPAETDGVVPIRHDKTTVYEFDAEPYGVQLYQTISAEMSTSNPQAHATITQNLAELKTDWPSVEPSAAPIKSPEEVYSLVSEIELSQ